MRFLTLLIAIVALFVMVEAPLMAQGLEGQLFTVVAGGGDGLTADSTTRVVNTSYADFIVWQVDIDTIGTGMKWLPRPQVSCDGVNWYTTKFVADTMTADGQRIFVISNLVLHDVALPVDSSFVCKQSRMLLDKTAGSATTWMKVTCFVRGDRRVTFP